MAKRTRKQTPTATTQTHIGYFGKFKPEQEKIVRRAVVAGNPTVKKLLGIWRGLGDVSDFFQDGYVEGLDQLYSEALGCLKGVKHSPSDIAQFSLELKAFEGELSFEEKAGIFLSALINTCKAKSFTIITENLDNPPACLGYLNRRRNILVKGSVGMYLGEGMIGGEITVTGRADSFVGEDMSGGILRIEGECGDMRENASGIQGGDIYYKGKLIISKGRKL